MAEYYIPRESHVRVKPTINIRKQNERFLFHNSDDQ